MNSSIARYRLLWVSLVLVSVLIGLRVAADETRTPLSRGAVFVRCSETIDGKKSKQSYTRSLVLQTLVWHGFRPVKSESEARFVVEGAAVVRFLRSAEFKFRDSAMHLQHIFESEGRLEVRDSQAEKFSSPFLVEATTGEFGAGERARASDGSRRQCATKLALKLVQVGPLSDPKALGSVEKLRQKQGDLTEVCSELEALGYAAVPYLLHVMLEVEPLRLSGKLPADYGTAAITPDSSRKSYAVFQAADHVLGKIIGVPSRISLNADGSGRVEARDHFIRAWEIAQGIPKGYRIPRRKKAE